MPVKKTVRQRNQQFPAATNWTHLDEITFLRHLAAGKTFIKNGRFGYSPGQALRNYIQLIVSGRRRYPHGVDTFKIFMEITRILSPRPTQSRKCLNLAGMGLKETVKDWNDVP